MRNEKEIIQNIIQHPEMSEVEIYNQSSVSIPNQDKDQSISVLYAIKNLKKCDETFLKHVQDIID